MIPLGFSGGSQDRLIVLAVAAMRWTVGTADGAAQRRNVQKNLICLVFFALCLMKFYVLCLSQTHSPRQWALWKALTINWYAEPSPTNPKSLPPWVPGEEEKVLLWWFENQILKVINKFLAQVFPVTNQKDNKQIQFKSSALNHANTTAILQYTTKYNLYV